MNTRRLAVVAVFSLLLCPVYGDGGAEAARNVRTYVYRPEVFADRPLGVGLPANPSILQGFLWYVRMDPSARALLGMKSLARFIQDNHIPGIDFTGDRSLTTADVERLFQADLWKSSNGTYQFRFLKLAGTLVGDEAMPTLGRRYDLQVLGLGDKVSDRGLSWLKNLIHLKVLELTSPLITNQGVAALTPLVQLERLGLKGTGISDEGLKALSGLPLKHLELGRGVTDRGVAILSGIKSLRQLDLSQSRVTRTGLGALAALPDLHTLFLGPSISDADLGHLSNLKNLKRLDLTGAHLTDAAADVLVGMPQLEELALTGTGISQATLEKLGRLPRLRYLEVSNTKIAPEQFGALKGFAALQVFSFSTRRQLVRRDIEPLARFSLLHSILVNGTLIGPEAVGDLRVRAGHSFWMPRFVEEAQAAMGDPMNVDQILEVASTLKEKQAPRRFKSFSGLERIHEAESSLEDVSGAPAAPKIQVFEDNEKNFLGEITVGVVSERKK